MFFIMKCIWQKYKIWLLIVMFYAVFGIVKIFKLLNQININKFKLSANR